MIDVLIYNISAFMKRIFVRQKKRNYEKAKSILLLLILLLGNTHVILAKDVTEGFQIISSEYSNQEEKDGVYLIEELEIDEEIHVFKHIEKGNNRSTEMTGAEDHAFSTVMDEHIKNISILTNENGIYGNVISPFYTSKWYEFSEERDYFYGAANIGKAALAAGLASLCGGPVSAFLSAAGVIIGAYGGYQMSLVVYTGGRYRIEGTHVRFEMTSRIVYHNGKNNIC